MHQITGDRRDMDKKCSFPLIDCDGKQITFERRSGSERRKNNRGLDVAEKIIHILN